MKIINNSDKLLFFDSLKMRMYENISEVLNIDKLRQADYKNHCFNSRYLVQSPDVYKTVLPNIYPIPQKSLWEFDNLKFRCLHNLNYNNNRLETDYIIRKIINPLKKYKIAVELSGGLDSSLIIGILRNYGIDPFLIGFSSQKFEFRTERYIQDILSSGGENHVLIPSKSIHPFKMLLNTPYHQLPYHSSIWYYAKEKIAEYCKDRNIDILISGMSGDAIFCEEIQDFFPMAWLFWKMDYGWFNQYVFNEKSLIYTPAYSRVLVEEIFHLRKGQQYDSQKNWARRYFKKYLPSELVNFSYKADHIVELLDGFIEAYSDIETLFYLTNTVLSSSDFTKLELEKLYDNVYKYDDNQIHDIFSKVSFANWIYSVVKTNKL